MAVYLVLVLYFTERNYYNMHKRHDVENDGAVPPTEYSELSTTMNTSKSAIKVSVFKDYLNTRTKDFFAEEHKVHVLYNYRLNGFLEKCI